MKTKFLAVALATSVAIAYVPALQAQDAVRWILRTGVHPVQPKPDNHPSLRMGDGAALTAGATYMLSRRWGLEVTRRRRSPASAPVNAPELQQEFEDERQKLARREHLYRGQRRRFTTSDCTLILVDDGAATGASMLAAVCAARLLRPRRIIVALPVASITALNSLRAEADEAVCISTPESFLAVGDWRHDFTQTTDQEVAHLLASAAARQETEARSAH